MKRLNVDINEDIYRDFQDQIDLDGRSASDVVRGLIIHWTETRIIERQKIEQIKEDKNGRK